MPLGLSPERRLVVQRGPCLRSREGTGLSKAFVIFCEHIGCTASVKPRHAERAGWQLSQFGDFCSQHQKVLCPVPPRPRKVYYSKEVRMSNYFTIQTHTPNSSETTEHQIKEGDICDIKWYFSTQLSGQYQLRLCDGQLWAFQAERQIARLTGEGADWVQTLVVVWRGVHAL